MPVYRTEIEYNGSEDVPCLVEYETVKGCKGSRDRYDVQLEPDELPYIEIIAITLEEDGRPVELSTAEETRMEERISESLGGDLDYREPPEDW